MTDPTNLLGDDEPGEDERPLVRLFLASSQDLMEERNQFESIVRGIAARPNIARQYRLKAVHWQQGSGDTDGRSIQEQIERSLHLREIPIICVLVGGYLGPGTRAEYDTACETRMQHGSWPKVLVYFKSRDGTTLIGSEEVLAFHREVIDDGVSLPGNFVGLAELTERLSRDVENLLVHTPRSDPRSGEHLRRAFFATSTVCTAVSLWLLFVTQTMAFPENDVSYGRVFFVLVGPPLLFLLSAIMVWLLLRLQREFAFAWHSAEYANERIYRVFRNLFPRSVIPQPLRSRFPRDPLGEALNWPLLALVLVLPIGAQFNCIFSELLQWQFVVEPHLLASEGRATQPDMRESNQSRYVERGLTWPYRLKMPEVRAAYQRGGGPIYVYSPHGNLGNQNVENQISSKPYRSNMGPEVFLPLQPLAYVGLFVLSIVATLAITFRLVFLGRFIRRALPPREPS